MYDVHSWTKVVVTVNPQHYNIIVQDCSLKGNSHLKSSLSYLKEHLK